MLDQLKTDLDQLKNWLEKVTYKLLQLLLAKK